jgi:hypothetical protein
MLQSYILYSAFNTSHFVTIDKQLFNLQTPELANTEEEPISAVQHSTITTPQSR